MSHTVILSDMFLHYNEHTQSHINCCVLMYINPHLTIVHNKCTNYSCLKTTVPSCFGKLFIDFTKLYICHPFLKSSVGVNILGPYFHGQDADVLRDGPTHCFELFMGFVTVIKT